jgi:hypothetical protein
MLCVSQPCTKDAYRSVRLLYWLAVWHTVATNQGSDISNEPDGACQASCKSRAAAAAAAAVVSLMIWEA